MSPPSYVTINRNRSALPQVYTQNTTILMKHNFWKISLFTRKTSIVCRIDTRIDLLGFWSVTPWLCDNQSKFQSYSTNLHTKHYHKYWNEFSKIFPDSEENLHCVQIWFKNGFVGIFKSYPLQVCDNQLKFQSYSTGLHIKHYHSVRKIVQKLGTKSGFVGLFKSKIFPRFQGNVFHVNFR